MESSNETPLPAPLLTATERAPHGEAGAWLSLPYGLRSKSRLRARLEDGRELALLLPRGTVLREGDLLRCRDGSLIGVRAAPETVSTATASDPLCFLRACYHLGNRHVALQIGLKSLRYLHDHVLDEMCRSLGLEVIEELAPFEPEGGAYGGGHHDGGHHGEGHHHGGHHGHRH